MKTLHWAIYALLSLHAFAGLQAQRWNWVVSTHSVGLGLMGVQIMDMDVDAAGNVFFAGYSSQYFTLGSCFGQATGSIMPFIGKLGRDGECKWLKTGRSSSNVAEATAISVDPQGDVVVGGMFGDTLWLDSTVVVGPDYYDGWLGKLDTDGNWQWATSMYSDSAVQIRTIACDSRSNIYVGGRFNVNLSIQGQLYPNTGHDDGFVARYDAIGNPLWVQTTAGLADENVDQLVVTPSDGVVLAGDMNDTVTFFGHGLRAPIQTRAASYIASIDSNGVANWVQRIGCPCMDFSSIDLDVDPNGNIYFGANGLAPCHFDGIQENAPRYVIYYGRLNPQGTVDYLRHQTRFQSPDSIWQFKTINALSSGQAVLFLYAKATESIDFCPDTNSAGEKVLLLSIDNAGNCNDRESYSNFAIHDVEVLNDSLWMTGTYTGYLAIDTFLFSTANFTFESVVGRRTMPPNWITPVQAPAGGQGWKVAPNPNNGSFQVELPGITGGEILILDALGRLHQRVQATPGSPTLVTGLTPGVYWLVTEATRQPFRIVVMH